MLTGPIRRFPGFDRLLMTLVFSVPASYKAIRKVPGGAAPVLAGAEASAVRLCQEVSIAPLPHLSPGGYAPSKARPLLRQGTCSLDRGGLGLGQ